jgi:hypothetical protein
MMTNFDATQLLVAVLVASALLTTGIVIWVERKSRKVQPLLGVVLPKETEEKKK